MSDNPSRNVAYEQVKLMLDFMAQHVDFATGQLRSLEARHISKRLWSELALTLNSCRGTRKTTDGWSRYWSDFKNKLKNKVRIINKRKRLGSTADKGIRPLTKLEKRAVAILGPCFEKKVSRLALEDHQDDSAIQKMSQGPHVAAAVKVETVEEPSEGPHRGHSLRNRTDTSPERQSDDDASSEFDDDSDEDATEPLMNSVYPKWVIEIERKRADAELARARAEETRAAVAARAARAAAAQAQALRTLAAAATAQADAVARIADVLDRIPALANILGAP